jgi:DNA-binding transcriptional ArsR family regulator
MNKEYTKLLSTVNISSLCFRTLLLLTLQDYTQSAISVLLNCDRQAINKAFITLKKHGLIELKRKEGKNEFYRAITDVKKLHLNIPGQTKLFN